MKFETSKLYSVVFENFCRVLMLKSNYIVPRSWVYFWVTVYKVSLWQVMLFATSSVRTAEKSREWSNQQQTWTVGWNTAWETPAPTVVWTVICAHAPVIYQQHLMVEVDHENPIGFSVIRCCQHKNTPITTSKVSVSTLKHITSVFLP